MRDAHMRADVQDRFCARSSTRWVGHAMAADGFVPVSSGGVCHMYCQLCASLWEGVDQHVPSFALSHVGEPWYTACHLNTHAVSASHNAAVAYFNLKDLFPWARLAECCPPPLPPPDSLRLRTVYCVLCAEYATHIGGAWVDRMHGHALRDVRDLISHSRDIGHVGVCNEFGMSNTLFGPCPE